ncbi:hypothetical protein L3Y34_002775 [Caenorhabditis briggsae]|uniref:Uncharacterized protein n=1 Tax=Caenorhabditis briggsae TaxID=6238 RepID=A0AAE9DGE7_CAEBR|nr:hypothetical protein L3Y34_002775 [Caenorhabditis briggsae]
MAKLPERKFMVENLRIPGDELTGRATEQRVAVAIRDFFKEIGFDLHGLEITIKRYGYMPDESSVHDNRYWATFHVDQPSALEIWEQQRGISRRIKKWNQETLGEDEEESKFVVLKRYQGTRFEAVLTTLQKVLNILRKDTYKTVDGFRMEIVKNEILLYFDKILQETFTIETIYKKYKEAFNEAVLNLRNEDLRESMFEMVEQLDRQIDKLNNNNRKREFFEEADDTLSGACSPPSPKIAHFNTPINQKPKNFNDF